MKKPWLWTEEDLLLLIQNGAMESISLEFKSRDALQRTESAKKELCKDVSSFANATGGTIIYGAVEEDHVFRKLDEGYDPKDISKEWIEQVINSGIQKRIKGVRIHMIPLHKTSPGRCAYIISIPKSHNAPHMIGDHRHYKRFNFQSIPMESYEVHDIMNRKKQPELIIHYYLSVRKEEDGNMLAVDVEIGIKNLGSSLAKFPALQITYENYAEVINVGGFKETQRSFKRNKITLFSGGVNDVIHSNMYYPVLSLELPMMYTKKQLLDYVEKEEEIFKFSIDLFAEGLEMKRRHIRINAKKLKGLL